MAILGVFTNIGVSKAIEAQNNEGFKIFPTSFGVSRTRGTIDPSRTTPNGGQWFTGPIATRVVIDQNTVKFICTIPANSIPPNTTDFVREIYLYGVDTNSVDFMIALGQPSSDLLYDPSGSLTLELEISLTNVDLSSTVVFSYTQATELSEHNTDPNAHPEFVKELNRAGMFIDSGNTPFSYAGQTYDKKPIFDGVKATGAYSGVVWTATYEGSNGNSITLVFDGIKTTDQVRAAWNTAHPTNTVEHNDNTGAVVLPAGSLTLTSGSLNVSDKDFVYLAADGKYKRALAVAGIQSKVAGMAYINERVVKSIGFHNYTHGFAEGSDIYLQSNPAMAGKLTTSPTPVKIGFTHSATTIFMGSQGGGSGGGGSGAGYHAVVSNQSGVNFFPTTQAAIDSTVVPDGGSILIDKVDYLTDVLNCRGLALNFYFNGPTTGWSKYLGTQEQHLITFSQVPTSGTWRIEWNAQESADLPFNADATAVQAAFNLFTGHTGVTVTGNYTIGFTVTFNDLLDFPVPTFLNPGVNEIQRFDFSDTPDDGTIRFRFNGEDTINYAWNDSPLDLEFDLELLASIIDVAITGSFASKYFQIEFINSDGKKDQPFISAVASTLKKLGAAVQVNGTSTMPVNATVVQPGKFPANNLKAGVSSLSINVQTLVNGSLIGPTKAIVIDKDGSSLTGNGKIHGFNEGIDVNGKKNVEIQVLFDNIPVPITNSASVPGVDYYRKNSFGINTERVLYVGTPGDYNSLIDAHNDAITGDRIVVLDDQRITSGLVLNKDVMIEFMHNSKIVLDVVIPDVAVELSGQIKTRNLNVFASIAGTYGTIFLIGGTRGHHLNLTYEANNASVVATNVFVMDIGANAAFVDGVLARGSSTTTNVLVNNSGFLSHNLVIRDKENGVIHTLEEKRPPVQEQPLGIVDGVNAVFTLTQAAQGENSMLVMVDGIPRKHTTHWYMSNPTTIVFQTGYEPQPGQDVYVYFLPSGLMATPPSIFGGGTIDLQNIPVDIKPSVSGGSSVGSDVKPWKDVFLKDKTTSDIWRLEIDNGVIQAVLV